MKDPIGLTPLCIALDNRSFLAATALLKAGKGSVLDVKCTLDRACTPEGIDLWRL